MFKNKNNLALAAAALLAVCLYMKMGNKTHESYKPSGGCGCGM